MTKEEVIKNGRDDMLIDKCVPHQDRGNPIPNEFSPEYLKVYYGKLFPHAEMCQWMSYGHDGKHPACDHSYFGRREFSFTLDNDIYMRFQSFNSAAELENSIKEKCPFKIDIGPVYSVDPAKRHAYGQAGENVFTSVERELVFDIDMSDYDDVRYCCSGADVCLDCWPLMTIAIKVMDTSLRDDFGFNHILWVYSGRRGVHCWVCDGRARRIVGFTAASYRVHDSVVKDVALIRFTVGGACTRTQDLPHRISMISILWLTSEQRAAVAEYFRVCKGNKNSNRKVSLIGSTLHPFLARSYTDVLKVFFEEKLLCSQKLLANEERFQKILELLPDEAAAELQSRWQENQRSSISKEDVNAVRWEQLKKHLLQSGKQKGLHRYVEEIVFSYTYPRLDMEVSMHMNHLLKAPFCVHPKTGRICIPIDPEHCDDFDPTSVPTLSELLEELNSSRADTNDELNRTSLGRSVEFFRTSFLEPLLKSCKEEMESAYNAKVQQSKNSLSW